MLLGRLPSPRVLPLYSGAVLLTVSAFVGVASRLVRYEEQAALQRMQQRLEAAADLAAAAVLRQATDLATELATIAALPSEEVLAAVRRSAPPSGSGARLIVIDDERVEILPAGGLAYYPAEPATDFPDATFAAAERHEFVRRDPASAIQALAALTADGSPAVRAGALVRLGRNLQKLGQAARAIEAYDRLALLGDTLVLGVPAELVALYARCTLLEKLRESARLEQSAAALRQGLLDGRWRIDRSTYFFYLESTRRWLPLLEDVHPDGSQALALAAAVDLLFAEWRRMGQGDGNPAAVRAAGPADRALMVMWRSAQGRLVGFVADAPFVAKTWLSSPPSAGGSPSVRLSLAAPTADSVAPAARPATLQARRDTVLLPWTVHIASADPDADAAQIAGRRQVILGVSGLLAGVLAVSAYSIRRAIVRELQALRVQSDFVAAVSHEFRTPLTSMLQVTELLASGRVSSEERRGTFYDLLARETQRLHRLVESLLDFGRAEAGAGEYRREPLAIADLVRETVSAFSRDAASRGYTVELSGGDEALLVRGNAEALGRALWNLLDNAVKYSPDATRVWVTVTAAAREVRIAVHDRGAGVRPDEVETIFGKFVRGAAARATGARGTGLGLSMVRHIARAHGGDVTVTSEPGGGSTFTMALPVEEMS